MSARIISIVGRVIDVIVAGRLVSHLRFAAGVCVLAAGLLMGSAGGAVAVADPDSSGSAAPGDGGTNASGQASTTASSPVGTLTRHSAEDDSARNEHAWLGPTTRPAAFHRREKPEERARRHEHRGREQRLGPRCRGSRSARRSSERGRAGYSCDRAGYSCGHAGSDVIAPVARVPNVVARVPNVVAPVTHVVASIPNLVAPVSDVIAPVRDMLTSVAGAVVPLTQLQSDLSAFLLGIAGVEPVVGGLGGIDGAGRSATADASVASQLRLVLPLVRVSGVPVAGNTGAATLGGIFASIFGAMTEAGRASSVPGMAPPAPNGAIPMGVRSFLRHAVSDLPVAVSVAALAAVALPGVGGLVILTLAGVRIGYRQAKAGFVLRTAGIARFAGPGPLGVVRSGSLVVVRPRGLRVVRPGVLSAGCLPKVA